MARLLPEQKRERDAKICADYATGEMLESIAQRYGLSYSQISVIARKNGIAGRRKTMKKRTMSIAFKDRVAAAVDYVSCGNSIAKTAIMFSISAPTLSKYVHAAGVPLAYGSGRDLARAKSLGSEMRRQGLTSTQIIRALAHEGEHVSMGWVQRNCVAAANDSKLGERAA